MKCVRKVIILHNLALSNLLNYYNVVGRLSFVALLKYVFYLFSGQRKMAVARNLDNVSLMTVGVEAIQSNDLLVLQKCIDQLETDDLWPSTSAASLLEHAVEEKSVAGVRLLISHASHCPASKFAIKRAFLLAMRTNLTDIIRLFLERALDGQLEMTLLDIFLHAVYKEQEDIAVRVIRKLEFDVNSEEHWDGDHPLSIVVYKRCLHLVQQLIDNGAVIDAPNNKGETALVTACASQFVDCCRLLLIHGANPSHHSLLCLTPLRASYVFSKDHKQRESIINLLVQAGLNVNRETWIQMLDVHEEVNESGFVESLKAYGRNPRSLKLLSFVVIRAHMTRIHHGISILRFLYMLPLPLLLKKYVTMFDE